MDEKVEIINDKEELFKKLKELKQSKTQQDKNPTVFSPVIWKQRPDKVVSTVVVGAPGVEVIPNNLRTFLNPRYWLMKLMLAIHFFLYRHVTMGNTRSVIGGRIMMIPLYKNIVAAAVKPYKRNAKKQINQTLYEVPNEKNSNN